MLGTWSWLRMMLVVALALVPGSVAETATSRDGRLDEALERANAADWPAAHSLAEAALAAAVTPEDRWYARETLAKLAYWAERNGNARALLASLLSDGTALFGENSPVLISALRMLGATEGNLGDDDAAFRALMRAVLLARGAEDLSPGDRLSTLTDLARHFLNVGENLAAALLSAEIMIEAEQDSGGGIPLAQEARALRALAHLRLDHPVEGVMHALSLYRLDPGSLSFDASELVDMLDAELIERAGAQGHAQAVIASWIAEAETREAPRAQSERAGVEALAPMMAALGASDIEGADRIARAALEEVLADDPIVVNAYFALLLGNLNAGRPDRALAWANRLVEIPPAYLAGLTLDPELPLRLVTDWLIAEERGPEAAELAAAMVALSRLRGGDESHSTQRGLYLLGASRRRMRQWDDAEAALTQALSIAERQRQNEPLAAERAKLAVQTSVELGLLYEDQGRTAAAEDAYTRAIALLQDTDAGKDTDGWAYVLSQLGGLYTSAGRLPEAEALLHQSLALTIRRDGESSRAVALSLYELGRLQLYTNRLEPAEQSASRALAIASASMPPDDPQFLSLQLLKAAILERRGRTNEARAAMETALRGNGTGANGAERADVLMQMAVQTANDGAVGEARSLVSRALAIVPPEDPTYVHLLATKGAMALVDGDLNAAIAEFRRATEVLTRADRRGESGARDHLSLHVDTARRLSEAGTDSAAVNYMAEAFAVAQRVNDISAGEALNKAAARLRGGDAGLADLARDLDARLRAIASARTALLARLARSADASGERVKLENAETDFAKVQAQIETSFPRYAGYANPKPLDLLATVKLLGDDEVLVLFATSDIGGLNSSAASTAIAVTSEGFVAAGLAPRAELAALSLRLRCAAALTDPACGTARGRTRGAFSLEYAETLGPAIQDFDLSLANAAYEALLAPVADAFEGKSTLILVPDKALAAMPFHLMLTQPPASDATLSSAPWLIRRMAVSVVPTVASLASLRGSDARPSAATSPFLGIGDPLIGAQRGGPQPFDCGAVLEPGLFAMALAPASGLQQRGAGPAAGKALAALSALPDTRCELQAAARLFGTPDGLLIQAEATEAQLKSLSASGALARHRVLSFATHGLIAGEIGSNDAGLVLTPPGLPDGDDDGLLTTAEIADLRLDADFVLLSACNTAAGQVGSDEGLSGLASAFFLAGARSLLVSHWRVYSDAASRLTTGLFTELDKDPAIGRAEALRRSMLAVLDDPKSSTHVLHPAYWGPFMIVGEGGPL